MHRLCLVAAALLLVALAAAPSKAGDDPSSDEHAALARVLAALEARPPETADEYRVALRELSLVGDSALPHLEALLRRYVDGPGLDDAAAHAFLGDRRFHHPIPEEISFLDHPFLRTVEEANAHEWFGPDETRAWVAAQEALGAMRLHHRRLLEDPRYRTGDQVFANVANDPRFAGRELAFTWADPYAVVEVGGPCPGSLAAQVATLQRTYRAFLAEYGERLGLADLMAPWGGGPRARAGFRSFPEGAPLPVLLYADLDTFREVALGLPGLPPNVARQVEVWFAPDGALHAAPTDRLGEAAVAQALRWFARQRNRWGRTQAGRAALPDGFEQWFAARVAGDAGDAGRVAAMRTTAASFRARERPYPVFPLRRLVSLSTDREIATWAQGEWSVPAHLGIRLFREQAWALVRMLNDPSAGPHAAPFLDWLDAWLRRETQYGMGEQVFARCFGLGDEAHWQTLDLDWRRYLAEEVLGLEDTALAPERPRLLVELMRYGDGDEHGTLVLVWDPGRQRVLQQVRFRHAPDAQPSERLLPVFHALDGMPGDGDGARPAVLLRHKPQKDRKAPREDVRLVLLALWAAGYDDIALDDTISPEMRALLDAWQAARAPARR
jgi:hypothetical protein